jgi:hypothetical protein
MNRILRDLLIGVISSLIATLIAIFAPQIYNKMMGYDKPTLVLDERENSFENLNVIGFVLENRSKETLEIRECVFEFETL